MAPLFWGIGALLGALAGAWLGCFCMECLKGRSAEQALHAAWGAMLGRLLGTVCKCGVGGCIIALTAKKILPLEAPDKIASPELGEQVNLLLYEISIHVA